MFRNAYQSGLLSILYSCGAAPLELWDMQVKNGYIRRVTDEEVKSLALEIAGTNVATTFIYTPKDQKTVLAINLPFLIMVIKNMKKYFTFEITILDDKRMHRRFRISNFQSTTKVRPFCTTMPIGLSPGWNQIQFNLADFTRRAYGSNYVETTRMQIHANCRIRRIYFADKLHNENELPEDYKLLFPAHRDSRARHDSLQEKQKKSFERMQHPRISVEAVPADEPPAFRADTEKLDDGIARQTTPVVSAEPSRTIVAPDGATRVQIEIDASESEYEMELESEIEEATNEEHEDTAEENRAEEQEAMLSAIEDKEEEEEEEEVKKEEKEEEERNVEAIEDENEEEEVSESQV